MMSKYVNIILSRQLKKPLQMGKRKPEIEPKKMIIIYYIKNL